MGIRGGIGSGIGSGLGVALGWLFENLRFKVEEVRLSTTSTSSVNYSNCAVESPLRMVCWWVVVLTFKGANSFTVSLCSKNFGYSYSHFVYHFDVLQKEQQRSWPPGFMRMQIFLCTTGRGRSPP
jgi:hypothetical protein